MTDSARSCDPAPAPRDTPLRRRARAPTRAEVEMVPWLAVLGEDERRHVLEHLQVADAEVGEFVCKIGRPANFWFGVIDGLLKMSNDSSGSVAITYTGVPPGAWFGEGTLLKHETYRYNIEALRRSTVAGLPLASFDWLLSRSIPFNRYVMLQLNERLGQFIAARETDRLGDPDSRVARSLAALFHPVLYPGVGQLLRITQQELGYLVGLSRQRVNVALRALQAAGLIRIEYGGVRVLDLPGLRSFRAP
ncbi:MAG: Crp/Fnr family transcriptional regulator [Burkholderiaceae bacterium]|nr:Crp/Fnr family transcriptional regulator [Burkholderiaceae bacterium]